MMHKKIIPVAIVIVAAGLLIFWFTGPGRSKELVLQGEIEGTVYSQIAEVPGKITEMNAELGKPVRAGDVIARIDNTDQKYALEQLQIALEKRQLALRTLQKGARQEELEKAANDVSAAEANYRSAQATYNQARDDIAPLARLLEIGGMAQSDLDQARLRETVAAQALDAANSQVQKAREQLLLLQNGTDEETIAMAEQDIADAQSRIRQTQDTLEKYDIKANCSGVVISLNYNLGSMVNPGYNLADISADNEKYAVCYMPTLYSEQISYGQLITVRSGKDEYKGEVRFIDVKSQYTPKDMQTSAVKNQISVKIKLLLPADTTLKPGSKVNIIMDKSY